MPPLLTAGLNGPKAGCACVCLVLSHAKCCIAEDKDPALCGRGAGIRAVQAGAGTEDVPYTGSLSHGNRQEKNLDIAQGGSGNDKTQPRAPQVLLSHTGGVDELSPPGLWALGSTSQHLRLSCQHFPPWALSAGVSIFTHLLHSGLHLLIFCCSSLDWGSLGCSSSGECSRARCLRAQPLQRQPRELEKPAPAGRWL